MGFIMRRLSISLLCVCLMLHSLDAKTFHFEKDEESNIVHAFAQNTNISAAEMKEVAAIKTLEGLTLGIAPEGVELENGAIQSLANCQNLESLRLAKSHLTDEDLNVLSKLEGLKFLMIEGYVDFLDNHNERYVLTDKTIDAFGALKNLESLYISGSTAFSDRFIEGISELPSLTSIDLGLGRFTDRTLEVISVNPRLKVLNISSSHFTDSGVASLSRMQTIEEIEIDSPLLTQQSLRALKPLTNLKVLDLPMKKVDRDALAVVAGMKSLERLILRRAAMDDEEFEVLKGHPSLGSLFLESSILTGKSEEVLKSLKALRFAQFSRESWMHVYRGE